MAKAQKIAQLQRVEGAYEELLAALGCSPLQGELEDTPGRAADLWTNVLLKGRDLDLKSELGRGSPNANEGPISVVGIGVHLVCPHHLTVAFGEAHVAYAPGGRLVGFGRLSRLVSASTSRLVLQEQAGQDITDTLVEGLGAQAAVVAIEATHPCHNLTHPRSHAARAVTWAHSGDRTLSRRQLRPMLLAALRRS